jgi:hypothetical protein
MRQFNEEENVMLKRDGKTRFGFVPHRLEIVWKPEWNRYPFNVLFMGGKVNSDGAKMTGSAIYEPEFGTYKKTGHLSCMRYRNAYGGDCYLMIAFDEENKKYRAEKFVNGDCVSMTDGSDDWDLFFIHLTLSGLANGERCKFEGMPPSIV